MGIFKKQEKLLRKTVQKCDKTQDNKKKTKINFQIKFNVKSWIKLMTSG